MPIYEDPLLNPEICNKLNDSATSRDKGEQRKQRLLVKSTIPLVKAVVALKGLEHDAQDKIRRDIKRKLQDISPLLHKSLQLNNTMFTKIQRKRKSNICQSLGKKFKPYAKSDSSEDCLFDEKTMKRINQDLKTIQDKYRSRNFTNPQKTGAALARPRRARVTGATVTNTTINGKSTDWGKRNISDIWHQYTRIRKVCE